MFRVHYHDGATGAWILASRADLGPECAIGVPAEFYTEAEAKAYIAAPDPDCFICSAHAVAVRALAETARK